MSIAAGMIAAISTLAHAQATYKRELPDSLAKQAKIAEDVAATTAMKRVPKGVIAGVELEKENGRLIYSYDIRTAGKSGIDEVQVSATTGKIVSFEHETPAQERQEAAADAKAAKPKKP
jgi:uncharacterized membrane protein YkoI